MTTARQEIARAISEEVNLNDIEPEVLVINFEMWERLIKEDPFSTGTVENLFGLHVIVINDMKNNYILLLKDDLQEAKNHFDKSDNHSPNRVYVKQRVNLTEWDENELEFEQVHIPYKVVERYFEKFKN